MRLSKKIAIAAVSTVATVSVATAAFAYWTTTGSGAGSASAGADSGVTVAQVGSVTGLVPGGVAQPVDFSINNGASTKQYVTSVSFSLAGTNWNTAGLGCSAADFTLVQPTAINADLTPGVHTYSPSGASLALKDTGSNQDACKNQALVVSFSSN